MQKEKQVVERVKHSDSVAQKAKRAGLNPFTAYRRRSRGLEGDALFKPLTRRAPVINHNRTKTVEAVKKFFLEYMHKWVGMPPNLAEIKEGIKARSTTVGRTGCFYLIEDGWLIPAPGGKYVVVNSRWLDPEENKDLNQLLDLAEGMDDPEIRGLVARLTRNREA